MIRTASIVALALALGGTALAQQQGAGTAAGETEAENAVGAPMEEETGVKGVYSLKSMVGLSTGGAEEEDAAGAEAGAEAEAQAGAQTKGEGEAEAASN